MNILFVHNLCGRFGGAEQVIYDLANGLRKRGHRCSLAYGAKSREFDAFAACFESCLCCRELDPGDSGLAGESFGEIVRRTAPDTLFFHNIPRLPELTSVGPQSRTVRMVHDVSLVCPTGLGYFRHGKRACNHPVSWRCWLDLGFCARGTTGKLPIRFQSIRARVDEIERNQRLDHVLTVSAYMKRRLVANGFEERRISVVAPALAPDTITASQVPDTREVLFVGSLLRGKGGDLLLRALQRVRAPFHLGIVGTGKYQVRMERLASQLGLAEKVSFHGWVSPLELGRYYANARIVVIPTRAPESFCLIGPEAMRYGRPVVAFDVGGISDWLEHQRTGLLIPEQDVAAFSAALDRLLADIDFARELGTAAAVRVRERFSPHALVDAVEKVLGGEG